MNYFIKKDKRYITSGVQNSIPFSIQLLMWQCIDDLNESDVEVDYLQVFRFEYRTKGLVMIHTQEVPQYKKEYILEAKEEYNLLGEVKVFAICDVTHSTILLANEY